MKKLVFYRSIFISWYCAINDCTFCHFSANKHNKREVARRSPASIFAEAFIEKELGWGHGPMSGGVGSYSIDDLKMICAGVSKILGHKIWLNIGALSKSMLEQLQPYLEGVTGAIETVNEEIHKKTCPSKPVAPYLAMFRNAETLGMKKGMTIIVGLGETKEDYPKLKAFIEEHKIDKFSCASFVQMKGTEMENVQPPSAEYHAWWIGAVKRDFPQVEVVAGIWDERVEYLNQLIEAGCDGFCKYPGLREFGSPTSKRIEEIALAHGRPLAGTLTKVPNVNWEEIVEKHGFTGAMKEEIIKKIKRYIQAATSTKESKPGLPVL